MVVCLYGRTEMSAVINPIAETTSARSVRGKRLTEAEKRGLHETQVAWIHHSDFDDADRIHDLLESQHEDVDATQVISGRDFILPNRSLLKSADEQNLFLTFNLLKCLAERRRLQAIGKRGTHTDARTVRNLLQQADQVRNQIMEANQRLVISIANRFVSSLCPLADMISEGNLTLLKAINCFDVGRGFRFSTYATYAIQRHLGRLQQREKKRAMVSGEDQPDPIVMEGFPEWLDVHPGELIKQVISELPTREQEIMTMRFGFENEGKVSTYSEIADVHGISKERVRQLIVKSCQEAFQRHGQRLGYA